MMNDPKIKFINLNEYAQPADFIFEKTANKNVSFKIRQVNNIYVKKWYFVRGVINTQ